MERAVIRTTAPSTRIIVKTKGFLFRKSMVVFLKAWVGQKIVPQRMYTVLTLPLTGHDLLNLLTKRRAATSV